MPQLLVDAMNVIGSRPTGWWRDRDAAVRALLLKLQAYAASDSVEIRLFVDGRPLADVPEGAHGGVEVLYASRGGPNAADDRLIEFVDARAERSALHAVTSDRVLADRLRARGVPVHGAATLLEQLDAMPQDD
jgi:predicted RNA-binding protein with PIN domain